MIVVTFHVWASELRRGRAIKYSETVRGPSPQEVMSADQEQRAEEYH